MTELKRIAANHRVAYKKAKKEFLSPVIFEAKRNDFFKKRYIRAKKGINNGYSMRGKVIDGEYNEIGITLVVNSHNQKVYAVRVNKKPGAHRGLASCTCPDFQRNKKYKVPCKHIWMVNEVLEYQ